MALWISSRIVAGSGGLLNSLMTWMHAYNAALRVETAVAGRRRPHEADLKTLGIENTAVYAAMARD